MQDSTDDNVALAKLVLENVADQSIFVHWRKQLEFQITIQTSHDVETFFGEEGAFMRFSGSEGLDGPHGVYDFSLFNRGDNVWWLHFGNIEHDSDQGEVMRFEGMPHPAAVTQFLDCDAVARAHATDELEFAAYRLLRSLQLAYLRKAASSGTDDDFEEGSSDGDGDVVPEGFSADEAWGLVPGAFTAKELRDWVDDTFWREGVDTRDVESRLEDYLALLPKSAP